MRLARPADLERIVAIYNATVPLRIATADTDPVTVAGRRAWFKAHDPRTRPIYVEEAEGEVVAWLSFSDVVGRPGYAKTVELSLYVAADHRRRGLGSAMLGEAIGRAPAHGISTIIGLVFTHNEASLRLMRKFGFSEWGCLPDVVEMDDKRYSVAILGLKLPVAGE